MRFESWPWLFGAKIFRSQFWPSSWRWSRSSCSTRRTTRRCSARPRRRRRNRPSPRPTVHCETISPRTYQTKPPCVQDFSLPIFKKSYPHSLNDFSSHNNESLDSLHFDQIFKNEWEESSFIKNELCPMKKSRCQKSQSPSRQQKSFFCFAKWFSTRRFNCR